MADPGGGGGGDVFYVWFLGEHGFVLTVDCVFGMFCSEKKGKRKKFIIFFSLFAQISSPNDSKSSSVLKFSTKNTAIHEQLWQLQPRLISRV